ILPGAQDISAFARLLQSGRSVLSQAPADRWRYDIRTGLPAGVVPTSPGNFEVPHAIGGYVTGFQFDAQKHRIPPKLVANANPAQLMLVVAAQQAMKEFDGATDTIAPDRTGVLIGTMFGGQFSNELQIGLRLPELQQHLYQAAIQHAISPGDAEMLAERFSAQLLQRYPALLDETGGFTASTLASRLARIFDLKGGAAAIDADEASGGLALLTAMQQLRGGTVDAVLCGTTQRAMDLVAYDQLQSRGRLADDPRRTSDALRRGDRIVPAEGVAVVLLQRLSDAQSCGATIHAVIDQIDESFTDDVPAARVLDAENSLSNDTFASTDIVSQIGYLGGGHGIIRAIAATVAADNPSPANAPIQISEVADDGYTIRYRVCAGAEIRDPASDSSTTIDHPDTQSRFHHDGARDHNMLTNNAGQISSNVSPSATTGIDRYDQDAVLSNDDPRSCWIGANDAGELVQHLNALAGENDVAGWHTDQASTMHAPFVAVICALDASHRRQWSPTHGPPIDGRSAERSVAPHPQ
ncbi:MAG: beta-ketoacyl synthase N-terminal-like domain-containing protein, partial [Planctomycetota bacterium]